MEGSIIEDRYATWTRTLARGHHAGNDALGTLRLADGEARRRAARSIELGVVASLGRPVTAARSVRRDDHVAFGIETFVSDGWLPGSAIGSDHVEVDCHGFVNTHVDALNHLAFDGTWFGGRPRGSLAPVDLSVLPLAERGIFTRAIHVDVPAARGAAWVADDAPITGADLDALVARDGGFARGDALLLDMGRDRLEAERGDLTTVRPRPGAGRDVAEWIADNGVSVVCWDLLDSGAAGEPVGAVHRLLWAIGLILVDNCRFDALRRTADEVGRSAGALVVAPLAIPGGTGSLVNPLVIF